jgi:hypothetical protein
MERNDENGNSIVCKMCYFSYSKWLVKNLKIV